MDPKTNPSEVIYGVVEGTSRIALDVLGPTVEFLTSPAAAHGDFCVMRGVIPPGVAVPLHSHDATEVFFVLSGTKQVLTLGSGPAEWVDVRAGDYVHVPRGTRHAHRNVSGEPLIELVITTARLGKWFEEVGTPDLGARRPPTPDVLARFLAVSRTFGYWLGTPEENAAVGIRLPEVTGDSPPDQ
jgi:quercetin dioxygenase-like cupin family protein